MGNKNSQEKLKRMLNTTNGMILSLFFIFVKQGHLRYQTLVLEMAVY